MSTSQAPTRTPALTCAPSQIGPCAKWCVNCTFSVSLDRAMPDHQREVGRTYTAT